MRSLYKKEIAGFFNTLTGYFVISIFLLANGLFLWVFPGELNILDAGYASLSPFFMIAPWIFLFLIPAITMRSFSEEKKAGTLELLLSHPLTHFQVVLSKYLASLTLVFLSILPCLIYFITVSLLGSPAGNIDTGGTWGSFIGLFFLAAIYTSVGIFASSLSENTIISFLIALILCLFLYIGFESIAVISVFYGISTFLTNLGINDHYQSMSRGVVDSRDLVYFIVVITIILFITTYLLQKNNLNSKSGLVRLLAKISILLLIGFITSFRSFRVDLTSEKRYTISKTTKDILSELNEVVYAKVYLHGELNIPFKKMQRSIQENLDEFKVYAGDNLEYEFINPMAEKDEKIRNDIINELYEKGLKPSNILAKDKEGGTSEKIIFPGAILVYKGVEVPVNFLKNNPALSGEENINNSIQSLEYELISKIRSLSAKGTEKIAFIEGHGELNEFEVGDITRELANFFQVDRGKINGQPGILDAYKAVIVAKPVNKFDEKDKFVLDQYLMNGGKVLWFIDAVNASLDSMVNGSAITLINDLNLDDLLFRYGIRINPVLVKDMQCGFIPVNMALAGNPSKFVPSPWPYFPLLGVSNQHPVTRNINMVEARFANSVDTLSARADIKKTVLLKTSPYSGFLSVPAIISLEEVKNEPKPEDYNSPGFPVAVLLEGEFESAFKNRMLEGYFPGGLPEFKEKGVLNKMLVVADGDVIRNDIRTTPGGTMISPLGFDKYTQQTFGNKEFVVNAVNFLTDQTGLINLRSREFRLRLLNRAKIGEERVKWQVINILVPVFIVILLGLIYNFYRKRKYS